MVSFIKSITNLSIAAGVFIQKNQQGINKDDKGNSEPLGDETECCISHKLTMERNCESPLQNLRFSNES